VIAGAALVPLLPQALAARAGGPRYRQRRRSGRRPPEAELFAAGLPGQAKLQRFADNLWHRLQAPLERAAAGQAKPPWRELDLLAGLALRYGRPELLAALVQSCAPLPAAAGRVAKWVAPQSAWHRRWAVAATVTWAWHDRGLLTRSALPLRLPA